MWYSLMPLLAEAAEAPVPEEGMGSMLSMFLPMILIFGVLYFMMIRPQRKKDKAAKEMLKQLVVGDRVCTIGGIYGTIDSIRDDIVTLAVGADKVKLVFKRSAIAHKEELTISNDAETLV